MIEVYRHFANAIIPTKAHKNDAGWDIYSLEDVEISLGTTVIIETGIAINIPEGFVGKVEDRSSLARKGLRVGGGVIDSGFNGSIKVIMHNLTDSSSTLVDTFEYHSITTQGAKIKAGDKIAQLVIQPIDTTGLIETKFIWNSARGSNGFGSSNP